MHLWWGGNSHRGLRPRTGNESERGPNQALNQSFLGTLHDSGGLRLCWWTLWLPVLITAVPSLHSRGNIPFWLSKSELCTQLTAKTVLFPLRLFGVSLQWRLFHYSVPQTSLLTARWVFLLPPKLKDFSLQYNSSTILLIPASKNVGQDVLFHVEAAFYLWFFFSISSALQTCQTLQGNKIKRIYNISLWKDTKTTWYEDTTFTAER